MSADTVQRILDQIQALSADDRALFDEFLAQLDEAEWRHQAALARHAAQERGIDQADIDQAVSETRYRERDYLRRHSEEY